MNHENVAMDFCERKLVIESGVLTPETVEIIKQSDLNRTFNHEETAFDENFDCSQATEEISRMENVEYFFYLISFQLDVYEYHKLCFKQKFDNSQYFAKEVAFNIMKHLNVSEKQMKLELKRFGESMVEHSFHDCYYNYGASLEFV